MEAPQAAYKACVSFLKVMVDDSAIIAQQYFLYGIYKAYEKIKHSYNSFVMFKKHCSDERFLKYQMWAKNAKFYLDQFHHSVDFTDYIDQSQLKDFGVDRKIKDLIWLMKNHDSKQEYIKIETIGQMNN